MATIHGIGEPVNDGERKAIDYFEANLPDGYIGYANLELGVTRGTPPEIDLIIIGEYAVYVIDVKGYTGIIKGNAEEWVLANGKFDKSPIPKINQNAKIVHSHLTDQNSLLNKVWIQPLIVLTNDLTRIELNDSKANISIILHLAEAVEYMTRPREQSITRFRETIYDAIGQHVRPLYPQPRIGDYSVSKKLGANELYTHYLAENHILKAGTRFLLKVYHLNANINEVQKEKQRNLILREFYALHQLGYHSNIAQTYVPFAYESDKIVLPLHWIEGISLRDLLDNGKKFEPHEAIDLICQVGQALEHAHKRGILHRDMRPDNIIIAEPDKHPVLVNFDFARIEDSNFPSVGSRLNGRLSEKYTAPEVWMNPKDLSRASDQYALGIIAFELLTGQTPYQHIKEIRKTQELPFSLNQLKPDLASELNDIIIKMCAFVPEQRYFSLADALTDLAIVR